MYLLATICNHAPMARDAIYERCLVLKTKITVLAFKRCLKILEEYFQTPFKLTLVVSTYVVFIFRKPSSKITLFSYCCVMYVYCILCAYCWMCIVYMHNITFACRALLDFTMIPINRLYGSRKLPVVQNGRGASSWCFATKSVRFSFCYTIRLLNKIYYKPYYSIYSLFDVGSINKVALRTTWRRDCIWSAWLKCKPIL